MRMICSSRFWVRASVLYNSLPRDASGPLYAHLETLVLKNTLDGGIFVGRRELCLENDTERAVSYNLALCVLQLLRLAGDAILHFLLNNFWNRSQ